MGIGSIAKVALNYVKAHPLKSALIGGTLGLGTGLVLYKAATTHQKEAQEQMDRVLLLSNPLVNPIGWFNHAFNKDNVTPTEYDNPLISYIVNKHANNENPKAESVKEFYENGGKGVYFAA
jgi:hypothetical protein